jgi:hypothetical protein
MMGRELDEGVQPEFRHTYERSDKSHQRFILHYAL